MSNVQNIALANNQDLASAQPVGTADMLFVPGMYQALRGFAVDMSKGVSTIPKHLQGNAADCMAVTMQAAQWKMNPFSVAQKTHLISGTLGYEAQLVNAVITSLAPTKERLRFEWYGDWTKVIGNFIIKKSQNGNEYKAPGWSADDEKGLGVKVWATIKGEDEPRVLELLLSQAQVRNSTLWASDPKQQLAYLGIKRWARLYCPDVIMGVYTPDELNDVQPASASMVPSSDPKDVEGEVIDDEKPKSSTEKLKAKAKKKAAAKPADPVGPNVDALIKKIENADSPEILEAVKGEARALYKSLSPDDQKRVMSAIEKADKPDDGEITLDMVLGMIEKAQNQDDLDVAIDLSNALNDEDYAVADKAAGEKLAQLGGES